MADKGRFHDLVWSEHSQTLTPRDIRRCVQLACVLEPISEKEGCTTRSRDLSEYQKLEYFVTAGVNIGDAFEDLATRVINGKTESVYDLAHRAQADSKKNRRGGRVNQGIIEFLFPLVISQLRFNKINPEEIIDRVPAILSKTSCEDVEYLQRMQNLAFEMSGYLHRVKPLRSFNNVMEYYSVRLLESEKPSDFYHNREIVFGFPTLRSMLRDHKSIKNDNPLSCSMQKIYSNARDKEPEIPSGMVADLIACLLYLELSCNRTEKIVR